MEIKTTFSQKEACICINSILKTSNFYKQLPQDQRGQLILFLKEKYFPSITNEEIRSIEQGIVDQSGVIMVDLAKYGLNVFGISQMKKGFEALEKLVGKNTSDKLKEKMNDLTKSEMK